MAVVLDDPPRAASDGVGGRGHVRRIGGVFTMRR
jgi:hypothetical protein